MGKCVLCGKFGLFVKTNKDGLCSQCAKDKSSIISMERTANLLSKYVKTGNKSSLNRVQESIEAQKRINKRELQNFENVLKRFQKARELEKAHKTDQALEIYLSLIPYRPEGTDYYTRPCIILEKQQRYREAIEICDIAIHEIEEQHFHADTQDFLHRRERLMKKMK